MGSKSEIRGSKLDCALDELQVKLASLDRRQFCAFFAACGEGLFPLYQCFAVKNKWGDVDGLRQAVELAWEYAKGGAPIERFGSSLLSMVEKATPDDEQFEAPESTFAQDVAICIDAALRAAIPSEQLNSAWIEFVLEPVVTSACMEETGFMDLGTTPEAHAWRNRAVEHTMIKNALKRCERMIGLLKSSAEVAVGAKAELLSLASGLAIHGKIEGQAPCV